MIGLSCESERWDKLPWALVARGRATRGQSGDNSALTSALELWERGKHLCAFRSAGPARPQNAEIPAVAIPPQQRRESRGGESRSWGCAGSERRKIKGARGTRSFLSSHEKQEQECLAEDNPINGCAAQFLWWLLKRPSAIGELRAQRWLNY